MRWRYADVIDMPVHVFDAAVRFVNEHVVKHGDLDDLE
jgi:hypothetical protein